MIPKDQLEQLAIQWHKTLTPALSPREMDDERLKQGDRVFGEDHFPQQIPSESIRRCIFNPARFAP